MRLWSVNPRYLDAQGLVACWREALLAQRVLAGNTRGYRNHPQLLRFRSVPLAVGGPRAAIMGYLDGVAEEASSRGYRFDRARIGQEWPDAVLDGGGGAVARPFPTLAVTTGQLALEARHLAEKLAARSPARLHELRSTEGFPDEPVTAHPLFVVVPGEVAEWEKVRPD